MYFDYSKRWKVFTLFVHREESIEIAEIMRTTWGEACDMGLPPINLGEGFLNELAMIDEDTSYAFAPEDSPFIRVFLEHYLFKMREKSKDLPSLEAFLQTYDQAQESAALPSSPLQ